MLGSVLAQELVLGSRRGRQHIFRRIYTGWLVLQLLAFYWLYLVQSNWLGAKLFGGVVDPQAAADFGARFTTVLVGQQLLLFLLAAPAYTAGAITDEKTRGTLQYLLSTDLTSWEIIVGKLLGRVAQVALLALAALPLLCFVGVFGGLNLVALLVLLAVTVAPLLALGSAGLLASVWCRQTRDAVLGVYLCVLVIAGLLWASGYSTLVDPLHVLEPTWGSDRDLTETLRRLLLSMLTWGGAGLLCLSLAVWRLRPAYLRLLQGEGRPQKLRWWRARRAAVPDEPIRWKERHVEGLAPLASLRRVPRWLGMAIIFLVTTLSCTFILWTHLQGSDLFSEFIARLAGLSIGQPAGFSPAVAAAFEEQGVIALLVAALLIGLRCSGAVTGERERQTWEAVLLTPLTVQQLIRGKLWGIVGASYPYLLAYAVPAFALALVGGWQATFWMLLLLAVTWLAMAFVGAAGLWCSVRAKGSWRSLMGTLLMGYGGGFCLLMIAFPVAGIVFFVLWATLAILDWLNSSQTAFAAWWQGSFGLYTFCVCLTLVLGFLAMIWFLLVDAQNYVADRERIRHWDGEPKGGRWRRKSPPLQPDRIQEGR